MILVFEVIKSIFIFLICLALMLTYYQVVMLIGFSYFVEFAGHWHWIWEVIFFAFMGKLVAMTMMFMSMLISKICSFSYFVDTLMIWLGIIQCLFILYACHVYK